MSRLHFSVFAVGLLSACSSADLRYSRPTVPVPPAWAGQETAQEWRLPAPRWWSAFGSAELDALVAEAHASNHDLVAGAARVEQARALVQVAGAALYPALSADLAAGRTRFSGSGAVDSFAAGLVAAWDPDPWGGNRQARNSAEATLLANRYAQEDLRLSLSAEVANTYFQLLALNDNLKVAYATQHNQRRLLALVEALKQAGRNTALDLELQRAALANADAAISLLLQQRRTSLDALALLTGRNPAAMSVPERSLASLAAPPAPLDLPARLLDQRPDILQVEAALVAAHADLAAARAALRPRLQLSARAASSAATAGGLFDPGTGIASIGLDLLATIFDGGRLDAQVTLARERQRELVEVYRQTVLSAFRDVEDALAGVEHFTARETALRLAQGHSAEAYRLAELRYRAGATDILPVLDAQRGLINGEAALSNARLLRFSSLVALFRALGGGWEESSDHPPGDTTGAGRTPP